MGTPERDQLPCRECGTLFTKRMVEQRHCTNADRGHPELYRGDGSGCFEKTDRGQRVLAAQERRERRKKRKADRLWRQRKKVENALARVDQARRQLAELEAAGEAGPDRRTRGEAGPAKNVQGPDGKFVRTTPPRPEKPQKPQEKRKAWFKCRIGRCVGSMKHPCSGCGIAESPQDAQNDVLSDSEKATTQTPSQERGSQPPTRVLEELPPIDTNEILRWELEDTRGQPGPAARKDERTVKENPSESPESPVSASQNPTSETPARPASRAGRGRRPHRTGSPRYSEGDRDQVVLRLVADAKEAREKQDEEETEERHVTACPRDPAQAQRVLDRLGRESRTAQPPGGDRDQAVLRFVAEAKEAREKQDDAESDEQVAPLLERTQNPLLEDLKHDPKEAPP